MDFDTSIVGGVLVAPTGKARLNIGIREGITAYIGPDIPDARHKIDADGLVVLPGGVDTHVHLMDPADTSREDFPTGTAAAAKAGVTTIIEHTHADPVRTASDLNAKRNYLHGRANVDYGLAAHAWPGYSEHIRDLWREGITFFKVFTCTTHGVPGHDPAAMDRHLRAASDVGVPSLIHAEDESLTEDAQRALQDLERIDFGILPEWRSRTAEVIATVVSAALVRRHQAAATIAHVSHPEALSYIEAERRAGARLSAEACPQYFLLREDELLEEGPLRKFTPPARARHQNDEDAMWKLLRTREFNFVSSDHAPSTLEQKGCGSIWEVHFGLPGIETTYPALINAVNNDQLSWEDLAVIYAEASARKYGLWPRKGAIRTGFDADYALVDPAAAWTLDNAQITSKAGWSPYAGRSFTGQVVRTILRGQTIAQDGEPKDQRIGDWIPGGGVRSDNL